MTQTNTTSNIAGTDTGKTVELWYTRCGAATASALAIRKGFLQAEFAQGGTTLRSLRDSDSQALRNAHYHHGQTGLFREGGNIPPIWAKAGGADTVVVAITWLDEYQGILVRADSAIRSPADLAGARLAIPRHKHALIDFQRGAAQHGFVTALAQAGLAPEDTQFIDIDVAERAEPGTANPGGGQREAVLAALENGAVDAIFLRAAQGWRTAQSPNLRQIANNNALADPLARVNNGTPRPVTVDRAFLERHPDVVARYLAVLLRTASWAERNPGDVAALIGADNGADAAEVLASHGDGFHRAFTPQLSEGHIAGLEAQKNFLRDWGYLRADFDVRAWIDPAPLEEARRLVEQQPAFTEGRADTASAATPLAA
ncbi:ABC transporter substrate-binding protein [Pseudoduganella umbonata]|uniref:ABC transporter substrate-binding protein n=1 Tax=Pseudoduganella umbonata TaxID=864828 RepID=A0A4P8HPD8_9BURK|nr:ABC transporter substrate-binding protein [Pseudoduganella umbonata]MBB3221155.1 ABC-type nitrate/sulfonate/bicarbonate transport system substrate-binding protein [Pseudoduganella umbonata]QCP10348.1 ABC transporter substrate-binding protein [Pseudoduganella umbonata]